MPIKYRIFQDRKLVYALSVDKITYQDLILHLEELAANPEYLSPMKKLVDYRNSTLTTLSTEESIKVTKKKVQLTETFKNEKCAFVTKSDLDFGMTRFHQSHIEIEDSGIMTCAFRNFEDALAWLEVDLKESEIDLG